MDGEYGSKGDQKNGCPIEKSMAGGKTANVKLQS
jgi:hypothetical protein